MLLVAAAFIRADDRFLICRRPLNKANGGLWEFPGGKIEPGETGAQAVIRECREELGIDLVAAPEPVACVENTKGSVSIRLMLYDSHIAGGTLRLLEHSDAKWIRAEEAANYDLCPADRELINILFPQ